MPPAGREPKLEVGGPKKRVLVWRFWARTCHGSLRVTKQDIPAVYEDMLSAMKSKRPEWGEGPATYWGGAYPPSHQPKSQGLYCC